MYLVLFAEADPGARVTVTRHRDQNTVSLFQTNPVRSRPSLPPSPGELGAIQLEAIDHQTRPGRPCGFFFFPTRVLVKKLPARRAWTVLREGPLGMTGFPP